MGQRPTRQLSSTLLPGQMYLKTNKVKNKTPLQIPYDTLEFALISVIEEHSTVRGKPYKL